MLSLSAKARYGLQAAYDLALHAGNGPRQAREVASEQGIPQHFLEQVLVQLKRATLVRSYRGSQGGYALARAPESISVAEMIAALEGPIGLTECTAHPGQCSQESRCHVREPWQRINQVVRGALERVSLADLAGANRV